MQAPRVRGDGLSGSLGEFDPLSGANLIEDEISDYVAERSTVREPVQLRQNGRGWSPALDEHVQKWAPGVILGGAAEPVTGTGGPLRVRQTGESERPACCQQTGQLALRDRRLAGRPPCGKAGGIGYVEENACVNGPCRLKRPVGQAREQQA
jgi:hypothetical protein